MKTQKEIFSWLKANLGKHCLGVLTSTDSYALVASVNLSNLLGWSGADPELFAAYGAIVRAMQPQAQHLAFHAIACELDWSHRAMIWSKAGLGRIPSSICSFEPGGSREDLSKVAVSQGLMSGVAA